MEVIARARVSLNGHLSVEAFAVPHGDLLDRALFSIEPFMDEPQRRRPHKSTGGG